MFLHDVVVVVLGQRPHEAEVSDLHLLLGGQQDVAGGQVPVDEALGLQVGHTIGDLDGVVAQRGDEEVALVLSQTVQQGTQGGKLSHLEGGGGSIVKTTPETKQAFGMAWPFRFRQ